MKFPTPLLSLFSFVLPSAPNSLSLSQLSATPATQSLTSSLQSAPTSDAYSEKLQEILSVVIDERSAAKPLLTEDNSYYVSFTHADLHDQPSLPLQAATHIPHIPYEALMSYVNLDLMLEKRSSLKCEIVQTRRFFKDKVIGTAEFDASHLETNQERSELVANVKDRSGKKTSSLLRLDLLLKLWKKEYASLIADPNEKSVQAFYAFLPKSIDSSKTNNPSADELKTPTQAANRNLEMKSLLGGLLEFPKEDEFDAVSAKTILIFKLVNALPNYDKVTRYKNRQEGIFKIRKILKNVLPEPPEGRWINPTRDSAMKRVYFNSIGMHIIEKSGDGFVSDTTEMCDYKYRTGIPYEPYGCKTFFDKNGDITEIVEKDGTTYRPDDEFWEWAKFKSRTSAFVKMSMIHVTEAHYIWGNVPVAALRMFLPPDHPIRRAFSVHFYKTAYTCARAEYSLFEERGVLGRSLSLTYEGGLESYFIDLLEGFRFTRFPDDLKKRGVDKCEFLVAATDGVDLHTILVDYVSALIDNIYPDQAALDDDIPMKEMWYHLAYKLKGMPFTYTLENVKMVWAEIIFRVTGFHSSIGQVCAYSLDPTLVNLRLQPKGIEDLVAPEESAIGVALITAITTVECPRLNEDWKQVFDAPDNAAYSKLRTDLDKLAVTIVGRNENREPNLDFHPEQAALSISS
jgi:hypothetical protein